MAKVQYKRCPRCELNYIPVDEEYCDVCKAELHMESSIILHDDYEEEASICPICKVNPLEEGEDMCIQCKMERKDKVKKKTEDDWGDEPFEEDSAEAPIDDSEDSVADLGIADDTWTEDDTELTDDEIEVVEEDDATKDEMDEYGYSVVDEGAVADDTGTMNLDDFPDDEDFDDEDYSDDEDLDDEDDEDDPGDDI